MHIINLIRTRKLSLNPDFEEHLEGKTVNIEHAAGGTNRNIYNKDIKIIDNKSKSISIER